MLGIRILDQLQDGQRKEKVHDVAGMIHGGDNDRCCIGGTDDASVSIG